MIGPVQGTLIITIEKQNIVKWGFHLTMATVQGTLILCVTSRVDYQRVDPHSSAQVDLCARVRVWECVLGKRLGHHCEIHDIWAFNQTVAHG